MSELETAVTKQGKSAQQNDLLKNAAKIAVVGGRILLKALSRGVSEEILDKLSADENENEIAKAAVRASEKEFEKAAVAYIARDKQQKSAMQAFRASLIALTEPNENDPKPTKKLVFVVDELDRCRPDYALSVLETIKHFFAIPGVHFVLGTNLKILTKSVSSVYGLGDGAEGYLT
ncbi:MAG: P-loop NTPase fold protein [Pseudomonadota bacterium]